MPGEDGVEVAVAIAEPALELVDLRRDVGIVELEDPAHDAGGPRVTAAHHLLAGHEQTGDHPRGVGLEAQSLTPDERSRAHTPTG
jgi:hypothetical protein